MWHIQEVVRKTQALHEVFIIFCQPPGFDTFMDRISSHWKPAPERLMKINVDDSFLKGSSCLEAGGVVRGHDGSWIAGFTHFENGGDALLAELVLFNLGFLLVMILAIQTSYVRVIVYKH